MIQRIIRVIAINFGVNLENLGPLSHCDGMI